MAAIPRHQALADPGPPEKPFRGTCWGYVFLGDGWGTRVEVEHDARPSVSVNIVASMNEYLKAAKGLPESVQKLQSDAGIKLVIANLDVRNMKIRGS